MDLMFALEVLLAFNLELISSANILLEFSDVFFTSFLSELLILFKLFSVFVFRGEEWKVGSLEALGVFGEAEAVEEMSVAVKDLGADVGRLEL